MKKRTAGLAVALVLVSSLIGGAVATAAIQLQGPPPGYTNSGTQQDPPAARQPASESKYVPITPCRIVDTRAGTGTGGTPFGPLETRTYYVGGTTGFAPQGGKSGGCGIPVGATAISATVTAIGPTGTGFVRSWPNGQSEPNATVLNYAATGSTGTGATLPVNQSSAYSLKLRNYSNTADIVVDVAGYYVKPLAAMVSDAGSLYAGSSRAVSASRSSVGVYNVTFDRDIQYCTATATVYYENYYAQTDTYYSTSNTVRVKVLDAAGVAQDAYVYVVVTC